MVLDIYNQNSRQVHKQIIIADLEENYLKRVLIYHEFKTHFKLSEQWVRSMNFDVHVCMCVYVCIILDFN